MCQSPEQKELEAEALKLFVEVNQQIDRIGAIIRELRELVTKGGEKDVSGIIAQNSEPKVSGEGK